MKFYSQKSYPDVKLGTCSDSIDKSGCFLTSFVNLLGELGVKETDPVAFNKIAFPNGGCLANASYWASLYNLTYLKTTSKPLKVCIAETDYWKAVAPQHFFLWRPDGMIVDPLDLNPDWKKNTRYGIVSYRIFEPQKSSVPIKQPDTTSDTTPKVKTTVESKSGVTMEDITIEVIQQAIKGANIDQKAMMSEKAQVIAEKSPEPTITHKIWEILKNLIKFIITKWKN